MLKNDFDLKQDDDGLPQNVILLLFFFLCVNNVAVYQGSDFKV